MKLNKKRHADAFGADAYGVSEIEVGHMQLRIIMVFLFGMISVPSFCLADGNDLLRKCNAVILAADAGIKLSKDSYIDIGWCLGYVEGIRDTAHIYQSIFKENKVYCIPQGVENGQIIRVILKYLNEHPHMLHEHESLLGMLSIRNSFSCE